MDDSKIDQARPYEFILGQGTINQVIKKIVSVSYLGIVNKMFNYGRSNAIGKI